MNKLRLITTWILRILVILFFVGFVAFALCGCSMSQKSWGMAGSADAFDVTGFNPQSGVVSPSVVAGGGCFATVFALPYEDGKQVATHISYARRRSLWNIFSSLSASNVSCVYIAGTGETPEQTEKILSAFAKVVNEEMTVESNSKAGVSSTEVK